MLSGMLVKDDDFLEKVLYAAVVDRFGNRQHA
jgi:hypothetical protein